MRMFGLAVLCLAPLSQAALGNEPSLTMGPAQVTNPGLIDCGRGSRVSAVGTIMAADGSTWTVPAETQFATAAKAADLFNECGGTELSGLAELDLGMVPVIDAGGDEVFSAFVFGDNYFEFFANGALIGVDAVPFTPFNSSILRFRASRPLTVAVMAVDWEENLGLGSEAGRGGGGYHPGDGGFVALIRDQAGEVTVITDSGWKAQTFYVSPLADPTCLVTEGDLRDSSACAVTDADNGEMSSGAHWSVPEDWMMPGYDDAGWPAAVEFSNETVGVVGKKAFTNFVDVFDAPEADAQFIWSSNLVLDNLVLLRRVID